MFNMYKLGDERAFHKMAMFINPKALKLQVKYPFCDVYLLVRFDNNMPVGEVIFLLYNPSENIIIYADQSSTASVTDIYHWVKRTHPEYTILVKLTPTHHNPHSCIRRENIQQL